ncbi:PE domain-containing protein [Nocardia sp. NPDC052278]|uniref:PE domain-containing protein n=1 Tax=unclassified Nocardia TaxID=2637762 RepID=UPI0036C41AF6
MAADRVATRLDALADRLDHTLSGTYGALSPAPAGADAVSARAAKTFEDVGDGFRQTYAGGVYEVRKLAAQMRFHAQSFRSVDALNVTLFDGLC